MNQESASKVLVYYIRKLWEKAGLRWDADNEAEVRGIVNDIIRAAIEP